VRESASPFIRKEKSVKIGGTILNVDTSMKYVAWGVLVIIVGIILLLVLSPKPSQDIEQADLGDAEQIEELEGVESAHISADGFTLEITEFGFIGYGPGKTHPGVFEQYQVQNVRVNESGVPTSGRLVANTASIKTDSARLDKDLCEFENFFNCATYPTITFDLVSITEAAPNTYSVTGNLTVKEVERSIAFTVNATDSGTFSSEFRVDMTEFGFGAPGIVHPEVVVTFAGRIS